MYDFYNGIKLLKDSKTDVIIGIEWTFDDGTKKVFYPSDINEEWFITFIDDVREMWRKDRKEHYHQVFSVDSSLFEGAVVWDQDTPPHLINLQEEQKNVDRFVKSLAKKERRRLLMKYDNPKLSLTDMAKKQRVSKTTIFKAFKIIRKKFLISQTYRSIKKFNEK